MATWFEELTHWKRPWCWERLRAEVEGVKKNEIDGWHLQFNGKKCEQTLGDSEGQGSLWATLPLVVATKSPPPKIDR